VENNGIKIDLFKFCYYILKRFWILVICGIVGFAAMYLYSNMTIPYTFTSSGTMYVYNNNPNAVNYQYTNTTDLDSAVQLIDTYMVVIKSNKVMEAIAGRLAPQYPGINAGMIAATLSAGSVSQTGVVQVRCTTLDPKLSADIVNAVLDVAPEEIIRVVSVGSIEIIDYASVPIIPDSRNLLRKGLIGAITGIILSGIILFILFLLDRRITNIKDLTDNFTPPILGTIQREKVDEKKEKREYGVFLLTDQSPISKIESYAKLRMNMLYTLVDKEHNVVVVTSPVSGEGKTTITTNLSISCAMGGKNVILIDGDMRRACLRDIFKYDSNLSGLSDILVGNIEWRQVVLPTKYENLHILPSGHVPPNPSELLSSKKMEKLLLDLEKEYDLVLIDMPPANVVSDPLSVSNVVAGGLFVARQYYTDIRDMRKALISAELTGMNVLGFIFYGENLTEGSYSGYYGKRYYKKYYESYYNKYDRQVNASSGEKSAVDNS